MKHAGQKSVKEELPKQRKGPKRTEACRLKVPTHIWEFQESETNKRKKMTINLSKYG